MKINGSCHGNPIKNGENSIQNLLHNGNMLLIDERFGDLQPDVGSKQLSSTTLGVLSICHTKFPSD